MDRQPDCATVSDGDSRHVDISIRPKSISKSPVNAQAVVVGEDEKGDDAVYVIALPTADATAKPTATADPGIDARTDAHRRADAARRTLVVRGRERPSATPAATPEPTPTPTAEPTPRAHAVPTPSSPRRRPRRSRPTSPSSPASRSSASRPPTRPMAPGSPSPPARRMARPARTSTSGGSATTLARPLTDDHAQRLRVVGRRPDHRQPAATARRRRRTWRPGRSSIDPASGTETAIGGTALAPDRRPDRPLGRAWDGTVQSPTTTGTSCRPTGAPRPPPVLAERASTRAGTAVVGRRRRRRRVRRPLGRDRHAGSRSGSPTPRTPSIGRLSLVHLDPATGTLDRPHGAPQDVTALPGFSIADGRLAWATPPGQGGEGSRVQIVAWTDDGVGSVESGPVEDVVVVH